MQKKLNSQRFNKKNKIPYECQKKMHMREASSTKYAHILNNIRSYKNVLSFNQFTLIDHQCNYQWVYIN